MKIYLIAHIVQSIKEVLRPHLNGQLTKRGSKSIRKGFIGSAPRFKLANQTNLTL